MNVLPKQESFLTRARSTFALLCVMLGLCLSACRSRTVEVSNVEQATQIITQVFDQWKAGATLDSLRDASPPVYVSDEVWQRGTRLQDFHIVLPGEQFGTNVRFQIELTYGSGTDAKKSTVKYLVTTTPAITIAREDR